MFSAKRAFKGLRDGITPPSLKILVNDLVPPRRA
jgi:hypothetical protein